MTIFNVTYAIVMPESVEPGDVAEHGYVTKGATLREAIIAVHSTRTSRVDGVKYIKCDSWHTWSPRWVNVINGMEHEGGAQESRSLHMPYHLTAATRRRIARLAGASVP